jgi:hypothetical protein
MYKPKVFLVAYPDLLPGETQKTPIGSSRLYGGWGRSWHKRTEARLAQLGKMS